MKGTKTVDLLTGIGFFILGLAVFFYSRGLPTARHGLGSGGYPMLVGILLAVMGLIQAAATLAQKGLPFEFPITKNKRSLISIAAVVGVTFLYAYLLRYLGFLLSTPFYLFGAMMLFGYRRYILAGIVSVCMSVGVFYLFNRVFFIFLPTFRLF